MANTPAPPGFSRSTSGKEARVVRTFDHHKVDTSGKSDFAERRNTHTA